MTAVKQFFKDLCDLGFIEYPDDAIVQNRLNLALELEKEQIMDAFDECGNWQDKYSDAEHYYNETYKKQL